MKIVIIGAGPAGEAAAKAASHQADVTLIEKDRAGGLCLNWGCIPSKTLLEHVHKKSQAGLPINWTDLQKFKTQVVDGIRSQLEQNLKRHKINLIQGAARFINEKTVAVKTGTGEETISFDKAVLAGGTEPLCPPPFNAVKNDLLNSDRILEMTKPPKSMTIVGGGAVGLEFACLLNAVGTHVTIVELLNQILPGEYPAVASHLARIFESRGMDIKTGVKVSEINKEKGGWRLFVSKDFNESIHSEQVLLCAGRKPHIKPFELEKAGVQFNGNQIDLNEQLQTSNPNIYAAGDVTGQTNLAHAAAVQGIIAAKNALGGSDIYDGTLVPRCLYTWPEVASVGYLEHQLNEKSLPSKSSRGFFKASAKALAANQADGFVQIVFDPNTDKLLGAQIIGPHATELIHVFSVALKKEMTRKELGEVIFAHPTLGETIKEAALK